MKLLYLLILLQFASSCKSQDNNGNTALEKYINDNAAVIIYENNSYNSILHINIKDSIIVYRSPMSSLVGKKYTSSRNQYKVMPIANLHPDGVFYDNDKQLIKIYPRENKPGFFDNISSGNRLRWKNGEFDSDVCTIKMNEDYTSDNFKDFKRLYSNYIIKENKQLKSNEEPPKEGAKRPEYKNYRNRTLNLKSKIEQTDFVLPTHTTTTKPTIGQLTFEESIRLFEGEILQSLTKSKVDLKGNLRGFILISRSGEIIEVLQEEADENYSKKNDAFKELALKYTEWSPAKHKGKEVICKVKYYIQKKDWD